MFQTLLLPVGVVLLLVIAVDFVFTTIGASIRRMPSSVLGAGVFRAFRALVPDAPGELFHHAVGPIVMIMVTLYWIAGLWLGWTFVFLSNYGSVTWADSGEVAGGWGTFGHAGRQVSTLGSGATNPEGATWYVIGVLGAISGMIVMTLGVSFILTTTATVTAGRAFCALTETFDPADPERAEAILPTLVEVVAALNASPFALCYSAAPPTRRLPNRIAVLARRVAGRPETMALYRPVLNDLPKLEVTPEMSDDAFAHAVEEWARRYELSPMSGDEVRAAAERRTA